MSVQWQHKVGEFDRFKATEKRRRLMKKDMEQRVAESMKAIIKKLSTVTGTETAATDDEGAKLY